MNTVTLSPGTSDADALQALVASRPYWYHKITLRDGVVTPGWAPICVEAYRVPDDLTGLRGFDVGAWDGPEGLP